VLPVLKARWPHFSVKTELAASHVSDALSVLNAYLDDELQECERREERCGESVSIIRFAALRVEKQRVVLKRWCELAQVAVPEAVHFDQLHSVLNASADASPCLVWGDAELRRFKARLYLMPKLPEITQRSWAWDGLTDLCLGGGFFLKNDIAAHNQAAIPLAVSLRREGLRCRPKGRAHSQSLKKLFQEYQLEPWLRDRVPLVFCADQLCAVGDVWSCEGSPIEAKVRVRWEFRKMTTNGEQAGSIR
jgi:tRNA(Ile)-lysidine synthase